MGVQLLTQDMIRHLAKNQTSEIKTNKREIDLPRSHLSSESNLRNLLIRFCSLLPDEDEDEDEEDAEALGERGATDEDEMDDGDEEEEDWKLDMKLCNALANDDLVGVSSGDAGVTGVDEELVEEEEEAEEECDCKSDAETGDGREEANVADEEVDGGDDGVWAPLASERGDESDGSD
jgi:hypothetical protein